MGTTSRIGTRAVWWSLLSVALLGTGCELLTAPDRTQIPAGGAAGEGGAAGSGGTTTTTTTTGGTGGMTVPECTDASQCAAPDSECLQAACVEEKCTTEPVAADTPIGAQTPGDCQVVVCDGAGATKSNADDNDVPNDGKECTDDVCTAGAPSNPPVALNTLCGAGNNLYCDGNGACVGCTSDAQCGSPTDCATPTCTNNACETVFTTPGTPIPMQTAGDCIQVQCDGIGGTKVVNDNTDITDDGNDCTLDLCNGGMATHPNTPSGAPCTDGGIKCNGGGTCVECLTGADCSSFVCISQVCAAPTCTDTVKNGDETDKDCGGSCPPCTTGKICTINADCQSSVCTGNACQAPTCSDATKNGNETDADCGGGTCPKCAPTKACLVNADCVGGSCVGNTCVPTCTDLVKNAAETDVDCGGGACSKCATGKVCSVDGDCIGGSCVNNTCAPTCSDLVKNNAETDVDCGGGTCPTCANGKACSTGADCTGGLCTNNVCGAPVCPNGSVEGAEQCDDNNANNGDGCSSTCTCEATQVATADPSPDVSIPDDGYIGTLASMACVNVPLTAQCNIASVSVTVAMAHTWIGDLTIKLVHPDNTVITLLSRPGEVETADDGNDGVTGGDSSNLLETSPLTFQTGAAVSAENMGGTITGGQVVCQDDGICTFAPANGAAPAGDLTNLIGKKANGTWKLCAGDSVSVDTGFIDKVTITVNQ